MANLRDIRRRIKSVKNTAQITKAMQLVAASKMKRAQDHALGGRSYARLMAEMIAVIDQSSRESDREKFSLPLLQARTVRTRGILLVTPDKGLCGPLVSNLLRMVADIPRDAASYVCFGRKGAQFVSRTQRRLLAEFPLSDLATFAEVRTAAEWMLQAFTEGTIDTIEVGFTRFVNTLRQDPLIERLAPVTDLGSVLTALFGEEADRDMQAQQADTREFVFEPDPQTILTSLLDLFIKRQFHQMVLESKASEHSARMVAMKTATDNAKELAANLTLQFNKARQAAITQEILEIAAATAATR